MFVEYQVCAGTSQGPLQKCSYPLVGCLCEVNVSAPFFFSI